MSPDEPLSNFQANLRRGEMLREQGRNVEAEKHLQEAITAERWAIVIIALYLVVLCFGRYFANLFLLFDPFARHAITRQEIGWSVLAGLVYAGLLGYLLAEEAWPQSAVLLSVLGCFLWGALSPRLHDATSAEAPIDG